MKKIDELISIMDQAVDNGKYATVVGILQDFRVTELIYQFITTDDSKRNKDDLGYIKSIIQASKALQDINQFKVIQFRMLDDSLYDEMLEKYKSITNTEVFSRTVPSGMRSISHDFPELVGTLDKAYTVYDVSKKMSLETYLTRIFKKYKLERAALAIMPKYDGSSMSATFEVQTNGSIAVPIKGTSRGDFDNNKGVDMGPIIINRDALKTHKTFGDYHDQFGIQYEIMIDEKGRKKLSEITKISYATRRAASAAAIKRILNTNTKKSEIEKLNECVSLVPVNISENLLFKLDMTWIDFMTSMLEDTRYGKISSSPTIIEGDLDELLLALQTIISDYSKERASMLYTIDGIVISFIDEKIRKELGRSNNKNQWQIAYKFGAMVQRTRISDSYINEKGERIITNGIISTHGKMGFIGHNITFEPIEFNGVAYCKAPVNNITRFKELNPHIGDEVLVSYNADVMGYIYKDETCIENKNGKKVELPIRCAECGELLSIQKDMLLCLNDTCEGNAIGKILDMISILNIDFFGEAIAAALVKVGITDGTKFVQMDRDTLKKVVKGDTNPDKLYDEFRAKVTAEIDYSKVLDMLRIPSLGSSTSKKIILTLGAKEFLRNIKDKHIEQFASILRTVPGIDTNGILFARALIEKQDELEGYLKLFNVVDVERKEYDKTVLVSGFRKNQNVEDICARNNWKLIDNGGPYDILIVTQDRINGGKAEKTRKAHKPIYTLAEFIETFKDE